MTDASPAKPRILGVGFWAFIVLMLALTALFVGLGVWQINRLAWKEGLIAEVDARLTQPPVPLPATDAWSGKLDELSFHPVTAAGHFEPAGTILVFTNLSDDAKGKFKGPGYWVMTPFALDTGGTVFVNRGFVPQDQAPSFAAGQGAVADPQSITGIALDAEAAGAFTPPPDTNGHIEWIRDPVRLATLAGISGPVFPMTIDGPAGAPGALPQGGETVVDFPNNHFGYALTWFGFALLTPALLAFWVWRQVRPRKA